MPFVEDNSSPPLSSGVDQSPLEVHLNDDGRISLLPPDEALATVGLKDLCVKVLTKTREFHKVSIKVADEFSKVNERVNNLKLRAIGQYCNLENQEEKDIMRREELEREVQQLTKELEQTNRYNSSLERLLKDQKAQIDAINSLEYAAT